MRVGGDRRVVVASNSTNVASKFARERGELVRVERAGPVGVESREQGANLRFALHLERKRLKRVHDLLQIQASASVLVEPLERVADNLGEFFLRRVVVEHLGERLLPSLRPQTETRQR